MSTFHSDGAERDPGDYTGRRRLFESTHGSEQIWLGCWACATSLGIDRVSERVLR